MSSRSVLRHRAGALVLAAALVLVAPLLTACAPSGSSAAEGAAAAGRPNIVLITTDDMRADELRFLPRTRELLQRTGVQFTGFVAPHPLCCPARAQLLTGQYAQNNGVRHNTGPWGGYGRFRAETALPVWLQDAGYTTAMVGKYLNEYRPGPGAREPGWDHWDPTTGATYQYEGFTQHADGAPTRPAGYHTTYVGRRSAELVDELAAEDAPFFLWTSFVAPHGRCAEGDETGGCALPPLPAERYRGLLEGIEPLSRGSRAFNEADVSDKPGAMRGAKVRLRQVRELQARRAEALLSADEEVARIISALTDAGELDDTLVVFTSDNGYLLGEHRRIGKTVAYEESLRVPLLMSGLGLPAGATDRQTAAMVDLAPTFAALAGATPRVTVDGRPLVVRRGSAAARPDGRTLLLQSGVASRKKAAVGWWYRGVRTARYTAVWWVSGPVELYDRRRDPDQLDNVAEDRRYRKVLAELARRAVALGSCSGAGCDRAFGPVPRPARPAR